MNEHKLNKLWRKCVCLEFDGTCAVCKQSGDDPHHLIKRNTHSLKHKYDINNGVWLCRLCHGRYENDVDGLLIYLDRLQTAWYHIAKEDKRYVDLCEEEIETVLKAKLTELTNEH